MKKICLYTLTFLFTLNFVVGCGGGGSSTSGFAIAAKVQAVGAVDDE